MNDDLEEKKTQLKNRIQALCGQDVCVAFSGGVDSSLILRLCCEAAVKSRTKVYAIMLHTMLHPVGEVGQARAAAQEMGADFQVLTMDELSCAGIDSNPEDRCYLCKRYLFGEAKKEAHKWGVSILLDGTNSEDLLAYRPGIRALKELGIISPLAECGWTKQEIRMFAAQLGLKVSHKPSTPCLATRFPYGTQLTYESMKKVEQGEDILKKMGLYNVRLRVHGDIARIEVDAEDMNKIVQTCSELTKKLKELGYVYITLDLEGFRSGSMDCHIINQTEKGE